MDPKLLLYARGTPFSGVEGDNWDTWIARFEARTSPLSDTEKLHVLLGLLEGQALDVCGALSSKEQTDYNKVKSTLEAQFNTKVYELQAFSAFSQATRQPGESIQAFGDRLKSLAQWTYQKQAETNEQVIQTIVNRFICGIQDPWLQRKLFVDRPKDLETAVKKVKELHRQQDVIASLTPGPGSVAASYGGPAPEHGAARGSSTQWERSAVNNPQQPGRYQQPASNSDTLRTRPPAAPTTSQTSRPAREPRRCFGCGEMGHIRRFCPSSRSGRDRTKDSRSPWCLCCGEDGHWMAGCHHYRRLMSIRQLPQDETETRTKHPTSSQTQTSENW